MAKYSDKLAEKIITMIEEEALSVSEICKALNISRKTFYQWKSTNPTFSDELEAATIRSEEKLSLEARKAAERKLEGYTLSETRYKYVADEDAPTGMRLVEKIVKVKECAPDNRMIQIILDRGEKALRESKQTEPARTPIHVYVENEDTKRAVESLSSFCVTGSTPEWLQKKKG